MNKAAQALGRLARGVPKNYSPADIARRRALMEQINARRRARAAASAPPKERLT